ncbi:MAG: RNA 2',3'-cyclic phosphodiesterase [Deltaproteobacteria bacterium]|nr:RNA 2',3'-cyclic phosphodiesterase [Deltaproteobacteria bacterium]
MARSAGRSRVFVALELGLAVRDLAEEAIAHLHAVLRDRAGLRFIRPPDLHVTLAFLGELEAPGLASLGELVAAVAREHAPLDAEAGGLGAFPRPEGAHVLWLGFGSENPALGRLVADLHTRLRAAGHALESRPWNGHVTLARCRSRGGLDARAAFAGAPDRRVACRVEALVVMESRLRPDGSHYTPIFRVLLSGGTQRERV